MKHMKMAVMAACAMILLFISPRAVFAAGIGENVSQETVKELQAIDYENNETIRNLLAPSRYSLSEKLNKKTEIARREGKSPADISDEQAVQELNQDNLKVMSYEEAFSDVQGDIGRIICRLVDSTAGADNNNAAFFTDKILQNKEKLLLGLTYLERLYDFDMGGHNIKEVLLYEPGTYGIPYDVLDWLIQIGSAGGDNLKISNNANVFGYRKLFWTVTDAMTLEAFLEKEPVEIAVLTLPKSRVVEVAHRLTRCGIRAFWNFAHLDLDVPDDVVVENVHLVDSLMQLSYRISNAEEDQA